MRGVSLNGTQPHIKALAASVEVLNRGNPFTGLNPVAFLAPAASTIYGVNRVTESQILTNNQGNVGVNAAGQAKFTRLFGDGATTTWSSTTYPALNNLHDDAGVLTDANRLATVLVVNGIVKPRVSSLAVPAANQWNAVQGLGIYTLTAKSATNGAYAVGTILEVYMAGVADIATQGPLVAGMLTEGVAYDFMVADADAAMHADRV